jgi:hypothetical protein
MRSHIFIGLLFLLMSLFSATSAEACSRKCCATKTENTNKKSCCASKKATSNASNHCGNEKDDCPCGNTVTCAAPSMAIAPTQLAFPTSIFLSSKPFQPEDSANFHYLNRAIIGFSGVIWHPPRV